MYFLLNFKKGLHNVCFVVQMREDREFAAIQDLIKKRKQSGARGMDNKADTNMSKRQKIMGGYQ